MLNSPYQKEKESFFMEIQITSLKKSYGKKTVLDNVSLTFTCGDGGVDIKDEIRKLQKRR